jgi:hypothetical protein
MRERIPTKLGFDINIAGCSFGAPGSYFGEDGYGNLDPKRKKRAVPGLEKYHKTDTFLSEAITLEAKDAVTLSVQKGQALLFVHVPLRSTQSFPERSAVYQKL